MRKALLLISAVMALSVGVSYGQDSDSQSQSVAGAARQARQQKQQKDAQTNGAQTTTAQGKDSNSKDATAPKTPKVITNDDIPEHSSSTAPQRTARLNPVSEESDQSGEEKMSAGQWKAQIQQAKNNVNALQAQIDQLNDSIHFANGNCVSGCVQWNEHQREKQQQVDQMKSQLEDEKKRLEDLQESARHQGYGSAVYDP